jgi:hypothetical protein
MSVRKQFEELPFSERPDLSPYLIHLTKTSGGQSAFDNLVAILKSGVLKGSGSDGFIKGPNKAACFMDVPFSSLKYILNEANSDPKAPNYEPYGIFYSKETLYKLGARPVLYLSNDELELLNFPDEELWRVVRLERSDEGWISWVHEREWRVKGDVKLPNSPYGVLVHNAKAAQELSALIFKDPDAFKVKPRSIIPLTVICQGLIYLPKT